MNKDNQPGMISPRASQRRGWPRVKRPELIKVTDRVYVAVDYALANVIYAITDTSLVVIDTTESHRTAQATLKEMRKITHLPVSHIIYTHFHDDHILGARAFHTDGTKIIAHRKLLDERDRAALAHTYK